MRLLNKTDNPNILPVKEKLKFLARDSFFFGGLRAIALLFPILTVPILTRYFSQEGYGLYDSLLILSSLVSILLIFGQDSAVARWFYQVEKKAEKQMVISESLSIQLVFATIVIPALVIFRKHLAVFYLNDAKYGQIILLSLVFGFLLLLNNFTINILKWSYDRKKFAILSILKPLLLIVALLTMVFSGGDIYMYIIYNNLALAITTGLGLFFCRKWIVFPRKIMFARKLFRYGLPLGLIALSSSLMPAIDRKMIATFLDFEQLGVYALAFKVASIILIIDGVFQMAWGPFSMSIFKEKDAELVYNTVLKVFFLFLIGAVFMLKLTSPIIIGLLGTQEYAEATHLVLPLCLAIMARSIAGITGIGISLSMKTYLSLIPFIISVIVLVALLYYLIPRFQLVGVAYSLLAANSVKMFLMSVIARKSYKKIKINYELLFVYFIVFGGVYHILFELELGLVIKLVVGGIVLPVLVVLFFNKNERKYIFKKTNL